MNEGGIRVLFCEGDTVLLETKMRVAPAEHEWFKFNGRMYMVAKTLHEYSPATDDFTAQSAIPCAAHVLLARLPLTWLKGVNE